jgi:cytosine/adenosine deaminase-related metal-dependent hydrolase
MPRFYRDVIWPHALADLRSQGAERSTAAVTSLYRATVALQQAGVTVRAGSGAASPFVTPGFGTWLEMLQLVGAGATLEQMWIAATRQAGAATGIPQLGVIAEGAPADLLIFREDPTRDAAALQTLEAVITQGRLYQQPGLNRSLLEMTRYFEAPLYDALSMAMARVMVWGSPRQTAACEAP